MSTQLENLITILAAEVGYLEKASNSQLDDKTANAGYNNYTKYGAWYGLNGQYAYWCHMLISWAAAQAGISTSIIPNTASCATGRDFFIKQGRWHYRSGYTPKRGDIVYFTTSGYPNGSGHVGVVYMVANGYIYTIEGNTSSGTAVIDNGGEVAYKSYPMTNTAIYGYGSPAYLEDETTTQEEEEMTQAQFNEMYNAINPQYTAISQVPTWYQEEAQELKDLGVLKGDGKNEINIRLEGLQGAVIALRAAKAAKE